MEATLAKESIFVPHPLTVVAVEKATVPVFDVNKYVRRPAEERHLEVQEGKKVKRPLNAFLLYRKTYQHVAHSLCEKKNHQHISIICAVSWRKESPETLAMFKGLAEIDSQKHLEAYPGYRYAPRKNDGSRDTDCEDDEMDVDDGDTRHVPAMESTPLHPADMMPLYDSSVDNAYLTSAIGPGDFPLMSQPPGAYYPCYYENGPLVYEQPSGSIPRTAGCPTISYPEPPVESSTGPMTSGFDPCLYSAWAGDAGSQANNDLQASHQMQGVVPSWSILSSYSELGSQTNHWLGDSQQWDQKPLTDTVSVAEFLYQC
ncbi:hypothetical protein B0I35DRAFT_475377 [Stachybotrys elegans]|uniref:HMG box domain-containing protein n=1 Tax=Stachybotrys elegans TaxID=80388 RepID=A0A8K0WW12_9HYPO|nr:hypothetical protein B0I35DRAFT_475377 [Stachybotrys elegans]